ncbi:Oidioi.mRNA.OKI2018_I69.chr2.g6762.t1.cds [Oikopleura dioica]|uniref:Oidioi.mRNA.OKI2018_I69.chr2.g6762.t1.cds n=1 Tax=Oikopleura dioica TaxID=34765 RepID=A0ABN7TAV9_OIKDI|nr:Oidioi.mRNA.OKI2018_I69.chr2.g6762.t1.cds [Oikopleura dioica]
MRAETLFLFFFWGTVGVPINYDKTTECYKTCAFYFPTEWIPYCLTHFCEEELNDHFADESSYQYSSYDSSYEGYYPETTTSTFTSTTTSTTSTSTTSTSTTSTSTTTTSEDLSYYDGYNYPSYNFENRVENSNSFTTTSTSSTTTSTTENYDDIIYDIYEYYNDPNYESYYRNADNDWDWYFDGYSDSYSDWYSDWYSNSHSDWYDDWESNWEYPTSTTISTTTGELEGYDDCDSIIGTEEWYDCIRPSEASTTTESPFVASFESNFNFHQCGISTSLLEQAAGESGGALVSIHDPPSGIEVIEIGNVIINGKDVEDPTMFPWMAALRTNSGFHFCGGAIIGARWILTAAHCQFDKDTSVVVTGTLERSNDGLKTVSEADAVFDHPQADTTPYGTWKHDITLIYLKTELVFSDFEQPVCLPNPYESFAGQACHLAGWAGLQYATMRVDSYCGAYQSLLTYDESFCAGYHQDNSGCNGDSGSALVCRSDESSESFVVVGVTSWASGACHGEEPTGFANVAFHMDWIRQVISEK